MPRTRDRSGSTRATSSRRSPRRRACRSHFSTIRVIKAGEIPWADGFYIRFARLDVGRRGDKVVDLLFEFGPEVRGPTSVGANVGIVKEAVFEVSAGDALTIFEDGDEDIVKRVVALLEVHGVQGDEECAYFHLYVFAHVEFAKEPSVVFKFE